MIMYIFTFPDACATVHKEPEIASIILITIISCVNGTAYLGISVSHKLIIVLQHKMMGNPMMNTRRNENLEDLKINE